MIRTELVIDGNCRRAVKTIISLNGNLTSIMNFDFELELNNLNKIKNSRGVNRLIITEGEFQKYL